MKPEGPTRKTKKPTATGGAVRSRSDPQGIDPYVSNTQALYEAIVELSHQLFYDYDVISGNIRWTGAIRKVTGYRPEAFQNVDIRRWASLIHPQDISHALAELRKAQKEIGSYQVEYRFRRQNGEYVHIQDEGRFFPGRDGVVVRMLGAMKDISERKQSERMLQEAHADLRRLNKELEHRVRERTEELTARNRELHREVEERRRVQAVLKRSDDRYRAFIANSMEGIYCVELRKPMPLSLPRAKQVRWMLAESYLVECNDAFAGMYGYRSKSQVEGLRLTDIWRFDSSAGRRLLSAWVDAGYRQLQREYQPASPSGEMKCFLDSNIGIVEKSVLVRVWGTHHDITIEKTAQKALEENERRFRTMVSNIPGTVYRCAWDNGRHLHYASDAIEELCGYPATDFIEKRVRSYDSIIHPEDRGFVTDALLSSITRMEPYEIVYRIVHADGSQRWVNEKGVGVFGPKGSLQWLDGVVWDITRRKRSEEQLQRLFAAIEQTVEGILITDAEHDIAYLNPAFERMSGYSSQELFGKNIAALRDARHADSFYDQIWSAIEKEQTWSGRVSQQRKDGTAIVVDMTISVIRDAAKGAIGYVAVVRDITKRVQLEARLKQAQKIEAIGTLAGGIAHDFNNILAGMIGCTELAFGEVSPDSQARVDLSMVLEAGLRGRDLVRQILTFSRKSGGEVEPLMLGPMIKETLKLMFTTLPENVEVRSEISDRSCTVLADPVQIQQILMNLCTNARHALYPQGGVLELRLDEVEVGADAAAHSTLKPGGYVRLAVRDNGCGMTPETIERIFDPFFTTKKVGEGTGLGLSVVHGIVKNYGGVITVESEPGKGALFEVFLPRVEKAAQEDLPGGQRALPGGNESILLIGNPDLTGQLVERMLKDLGYRITCSANRQEILQTMMRRPEVFDLVFAHQRMLEVLGYEITNEIRELNPDIPIVLCASFNRKIGTNDAWVQNISKVVYKPLLLSQLAQAVRDVLGRRD